MNEDNNTTDIEDKADSGEEGDEGEEESSQVYQIRPKLEEKFKPLAAKEVIHNVLFDLLSTKIYDSEEAQSLTKEISDSIRDKMKKLGYRKYKFVVNVCLGARNGAGVKIGTRCIWDAETDSYAHDSFMNDSLFCVAAVYAVYLY